MKIYTIKPQPFGEDAVPKEVRYIVATARARGERTLIIDCRACSPYLHTAARHALAALKREGRIEFFVPAARLGTDDVGAALLSSRIPTLGEHPLLAADGDKDGLTVVSL